MAPPPSGPDIDSLIDQASVAVDKTEAVRQLHANRRKRSRGPLIGSAVAALVIAYSGSQIWGHLAPPSEKQVAKDLEQTVEQARAVIDQTRKETGQLPDVLPAAMASVVRYDKADKAYTLSATVLGVRVTLASDGMKRTDFGVRE